MGRLPATPPSWMAAAFIVASLLAAAVLSSFGVGEHSTAIALRLTARWSFVLFWFAYAGSAMAKLFGSHFDGLARRSRDFGLAYASAQVVHVGLVLWIFYLAPAKNGGMVFFWVGILCTYLLALFSLPRLREALGFRLWRMFRSIALEYIALVFAADFILGPLQATRLGGFLLLTYIPFALLLVGGLGLRLASVVRYRLRPRRTTLSELGFRGETVPGVTGKQPQISKPITTVVGFLFSAAIGMGLLDLSRGLNELTALIALGFIVVGVFNTWGALNSN